MELVNDFLNTVSVALLIWSGLVALVLSTWALAVLRRLGATRYLPRAYWSCAIFRRSTDLTLAGAGMLRMVAMIVVFPFAYAVAFAVFGQAEALTGAAIGAFHGLLASTLLPFAARRCSGAIAPGIMGWNLGRTTPVVLVFVHALYGAALGYFYVMPSA